MDDLASRKQCCSSGMEEFMAELTDGPPEVEAEKDWTGLQMQRCWRDRFLWKCSGKQQRRTWRTMSSGI